MLWDESKKRLIAGRDRYGIKSLYYTWHEGKLLVATEMKSFLRFGKVMEWGVRELREQSWRVGSETYFKGIYRVSISSFFLEILGALWMRRRVR